MNEELKTPCRLVWLVYTTVWHSGVRPGAMVANVAQLVEQRFRKARVAGSSPVVGSILFQLLFCHRWTQIKHRFLQYFLSFLPKAATGIFSNWPDKTKRRSVRPPFANKVFRKILTQQGSSIFRRPQCGRCPSRLPI